MTDDFFSVPPEKRSARILSRPHAPLRKFATESAYLRLEILNNLVVVHRHGRPLSFES
jgi:hypothetical protein